MRNVAEITREKAFWLLDLLKGGNIKKHYTSIKQLIENTAGGEITNKIKQGKLHSILDHTVNTTGFYQHLKNYTALSDFPVIDKTIIRENFEKFTSAIFTPEQLIPVVTSGSTGTPFKVMHSADKRLRNNADTMYFAKLAGFTIGDKLVYLKIWSDLNRKPGLQKWMQNIMPVDVISFSDTQIALLIETMEKSNETFGFLGYSSAIELVCKYLDKTNHGKVKTKLVSAISMSEALNDYTKTTIDKYFGVPVYSRYSNIENGILAQQIPGQANRFLVNTASYVAEILKIDSDQPAVYGELGRLVVTDLYNRAMPLIRYDTGDIAAFSNNTDKYGNTYLETIEGRKLDLLFATDGSLVSSYIVYKNMWQYTEITQYQLVQYGPGQYTFKVNMEGGFLRKEKLIREFKEYLGEDADFKVEFVDEIPLLSSGKRKKIVNTYHSSVTASN